MTTPHSVVPISTPPSEDPQAHEEQYVHAVYDKIASHFSSTRYKVHHILSSRLKRGISYFSPLEPWPIIAKFLDSLQPGSIGLDSGTGNGKYLPLPGVNLGVGLSVWMIGLDRSRNLLEIAKHAGAENDDKLCREVVCGDVLSGCWRPGVFVRFPTKLNKTVGLYRFPIGFCYLDSHNTSSLYS
jgi:tRNA (uracil-5-)-methyltransferase TRM9